MTRAPSRWDRSTWRSRQPSAESCSSHDPAGAYANFLATATEEDVAAIYPEETYQRLAAVKRRYDPGNLFARNHNVRPQ